MLKTEGTNSKILLSIIVPVYKVESYLKQCIESLINQTAKNIEIVLVNDGSPDHCPAICDSYAAKDSRIKVVHKPNGGLVSARKAGLAQSTGDYIAFVDGDDWVETTYYEKVLAVLEQLQPDIFVSAGFFKVEESVKQCIFVEKYRGFYHKTDLESKVFKELIFRTEPPLDHSVTPSLWSKIMRRTLLEKVIPEVPENIRLGENLAVTVPCILNARTIYFSDLCGYCYRQVSNSMTHVFDSTAPERINTLLVFLQKKTAAYKQYNFEKQLAVYGTFFVKNLLSLLVCSNSNYRFELQKITTLFQNELIQKGLKMPLPIKTKVLIMAAQKRKIWILKLLKKRWVQPE